MREEPVLEGDAIEAADVGHTGLGRNDGLDDRRCAERKRVLRLVDRAQLRRREEGFQAVERCADLQARDARSEVEQADVAARVDERMRVVLQQQVVHRADLGHKAEDVEVAAEEDVEAHLDVVAGAVAPRRDLAADVRSLVVHVDMVALVE